MTDSVARPAGNGSVSAWLRPAAVPILVLGAVAALTFLYYRAFAEFPCNSDCAGPFLAAKDMAAGNWRLKGWWWGSDPFLTSDLAFEARLVALLGDHPVIMMITAAFDWAGVVVLSAVAAVTGRARSPYALLPVAVIIVAPVLRDNGFMYMIAYVPMHIGSILYILAMFLLAPAASTKGRAAVPALIALGVATFLAVAGDPMTLVVGAGAIAVVMAIAAAKHKDRRKALVLATVLGAALLGKAVVVLNQAFGGIHLAVTPMTFVSFEDLSRNINLTFKSMLMLTGSDFFGKELGSALLSLIRFPLLLIMGWVLYAAGRRFAGYALGTQQTPEPALLDQLLLVAAVINILAALTSGLLVNITAARYFIPAVIFLAILTGRTLAAVPWFKVYGCLALGATVLLLGYAYAKAPPVPTLFPPEVGKLGDALVRHHLTDGYAAYWRASITTIATRGAARVRGVTVDPATGKVVPLRLIARDDWYAGFGRRDRPFFVVIDKLDPAQGLAEGPVTATFGKPSRRYDLPEFAIEVFDPVAPGG